MKPTLNEEASYFFACMKDGFTSRQQEAFELWINQSDAHRQAFDRIKNVEYLYRALPQTMKETMIKNVHDELKRQTVSKQFRSFAIAASILLVLCLGVYERYLAFYLPHAYETGKMTQKVLLPDESSVLLDAKTKATMCYRGDKREVVLQEGKALFSVTKNQDMPFFVRAGDLSVRVVGTRFEIKNYGGSVDVSVIEGTVSVQKDDDALAVLTQGKKLVYTVQTGRVSLQSVMPENIASWKEGMLIFHDETLTNALNEFGHYQDLTIVIPNELKNYTVSGSFEIGSVDKFLYALTKIYPLKVSHVGDVLYIQKKYKKNN
ncbi:FecR domain-containing protein [Sulfurospirillum sp. MES]|uniref:FecR family protein n=1 Tax=Sulfurospirillum sp. MES TaxID=1565314 RepID=UPI000541AE78|nr:FecR domain-containing protein [Sulfurospirillum sp. MES]KHG34009.1 MAG: hypothetical protein OA34_06590 [Sulfurospirillum sp. MES]